MKRYEKINEHYLKDNYTRKKITLNQACELLNTYEEALCQSEKN